MDDSLDTEARALRLQRSFAAFLTVTALALGGASLRAQTASAMAPADKPNQPMKQFVIIFRQGPRQLTEADPKDRAEETRAWAQRQNAAGHKLDPHILAPESHWSGPDGSSGPVPATSAGPITALLFLEARDFAQAVDVARAHPALCYGAGVEVRPWAPPSAPPPTAQP
jgi:hypothetical protein